MRIESQQARQLFYLDTVFISVRIFLGVEVVLINSSQDPKPSCRLLAYVSQGIGKKTGKMSAITNKKPESLSFEASVCLLSEFISEEYTTKRIQELRELGFFMAK